MADHPRRSSNATRHALYKHLWLEECIPVARTDVRIVVVVGDRTEEFPADKPAEMTGLNLPTTYGAYNYGTDTPGRP